MNEVLRSILSSRSVITEGGIVRPLHANISEEEGSFIQGIIREARPQVSLEVGCAYGVSSLYICEALCEVNAVKHIIIDSHQSFPYGKWIFYSERARAARNPLILLRASLEFGINVVPQNRLILGCKQALIALDRGG